MRKNLFFYTPSQKFLHKQSKPKACISLKFVYNEKVCVKHIFVGGKNL